MRKVKLIQSAIVILTVLFITTIVSCKKDDSTSPKTKTEIISGKNFFMKALTVSPAVSINGIPVTDFFVLLPACSTDDFTVYNANGTVTYDEGLTKCEPDDPQTQTGTWSFTENETKISETFDGETQSYNLIELTETTLKMSYSIVEDFGDGEKSYTFTGTYSVQ